MNHRVFLAGAGGVLGRRLTPLLLAAGHAVAGTTRSSATAERLRACGVEPVLVDVFDAEALKRVVARWRPSVVIHQLTDLPSVLDPGRMGDALRRNARIREEGTCNLVEAAGGAGVGRIVAQSIAWAYAPGPQPHREGDRLDLATEGDRAITVGGVAALEDAVLTASGMAGVVLRYGRLYGPGTGSAAPTGTPSVHVDAAAHAALLALHGRASGIFNVVDPCPSVSAERARAELEWRPGFRSGGPDDDGPD